LPTTSPPKGRGRITEKTLPNPPPPSGRGRKKVGEGYSHLKRIKGEVWSSKRLNGTFEFFL